MSQRVCRSALFNPRPRRKGVPRGFTLPGGLQTIADTLTGQPGMRVALGQTVRTIQRVGETFIVQTGQGEYTARALCLATPVAVAAELLRATFPTVAERLAEVDTVTVGEMWAWRSLPTGCNYRRSPD